MDGIFSEGVQSILVRGNLVAADKNVNYIRSGSIGLYSTEENDRSLLFVYKAGDIFPYHQTKSELLSGRVIEYRALSPACIFSLSRKKFEEEAFKPENIKLFVDNLMEVVQLQIERIDNMGRNTAYQKLIERLNFFVLRLAELHGDKAIISTPMSHADIATSIGTTRETVNRFMKQLEKRGVITIKNQTIIINSVSALKEMVDSSHDPTDKHSYLMLASIAAATLQGIVTVI